MKNPLSNARLGRLARAWKLWVGLLGLALVMAWAGDAFRKRVAPGDTVPQAGRPLPADAEIIVVTNALIHPRISVVGTVASERTVHLSARLAAYVREVNVSAGERVAEGDLLVTLDDRDLRQQLDASEARLGRAEAEFARVERLTETGAATARDFDLAEATLTAARAELEQVRVSLSDTRIRAPSDAVVTDRRVEAGDLASPGQVLLVLYDPDAMRFEAPVPVRLLDHFPVGRECEVTVEYPPARLRARVSEMVGAIDPTTRTRIVKLQLDAAGHILLPGAFGRIRVRETPHEGLCLPRSAIRRVGQLESVYVVSNGTMRRGLVTTVAADDDHVEVLSGLSEGEQVLVWP